MYNSLLLLASMPSMADVPHALRVRRVHRAA